jgi:hypothetical protein
MSKLIIVTIPVFDTDKRQFTRLTDEKKEWVKNRQAVYSRVLSIFNKDVSSYKYSNIAKRKAMQALITGDIIGMTYLFEGSAENDASIQRLAISMERTFEKLCESVERLIPGNLDGTDLERWIGDDTNQSRKKRKQRLYEDISTKEFNYIRDRIRVIIG